MEAVLTSPLGNIKIVVAGNRLTSLCFTREQATPLPEDDTLRKVKGQLAEYFAGNKTSFTVPLAPAGTNFQQNVWRQLQAIPYGTTISYRQLAHRLGDPRCIRAAARANGQNPIAIIIPCHRVIGSDGRLTGYAGGLDKKAFLLNLEGATVMNQITIF